MKKTQSYINMKDFGEEEKEDGSFASQFLRNSKLP